MMVPSLALFLLVYLAPKSAFSPNSTHQLAFPMEFTEKHSLDSPINRTKRQFGFGGLGGCCPFGGIGPMMPMCCSMPIMAPCCIPPLLPPILPPPMPILPPPILPMMGGCCSCCMPMCVPICVRSSCGGGLFGGGLFGGGCPFGGWRKKMMAKQRKKNKLVA